MATWFCDAYASWQEGAVEDANGRLRRDLPRDLDLDALSDAELQESDAELQESDAELQESDAELQESDAELQESVLSHNLTPRKCPGFLTPLQAPLGELGRDVRIRFA
jgi:transposase, IS30 family